MQNMSFTKQLAVLIFSMVLIPLLIGLYIYLLLDSSACVSQFLIRAIPTIQTHVDSVSESLSVFIRLIRNYLCDFCWAFSLESSVFLLLQTENTFMNSTFLSVALSFGIELAQMTNRVIGTFDVWDLVVETIAILLAGLILFFYKRRNAT